MNQHVSFQMISFGACVAALVAAVGLLSIMLKHVRFVVFGRLEGEIGLKTCKSVFFILLFHRIFLFLFVRLNQSGNKGGI